MLFHDSIADAQSQSGSLAYWLGGIEPDEGAIHIGQGGNGVNKAGHHTASPADCLDADFLLAASLQPVDGGGPKVSQDSFELVFIQRDRRQIGLNFQLD